MGEWKSGERKNSFYLVKKEKKKKWEDKICNLLSFINLLSCFYYIKNNFNSL